MATVTVVLALLPLGSWSADAAAPVARKSGCTIVGGPGPDVLVGTPDDDVICGRGGDDKLVGRGGDDELRGGRGDDEMVGGPGSDLVRGEAGSDTITGGRGDDHLRGGRGKDDLDGRDASGFHDLVQCGPGPGDTAFADPLDDVVSGCEEVNQNDPPSGIKLVPDTVAENAPVGTVVGKLTATDPDQNDKHHFALVAGPGSGDNASFTITGRRLRTTAAFDFETDPTLSIRVRATDLADESVTRKLTVTVTDVPENGAPVAADDSRSTPEDTTLTLPVSGAGSPVANDTDPDGDPLSVTVVSGAVGGTATITSGTIRFVPAADLCGPATGRFDYTVSDGRGGTDVGRVTVDITCVPDDPTAANDAATRIEDSSATAIAVLANDTDPDGGPKTISSASDPANGTVVLTGGSPGAHTGLTYAPDPSYCNDPPGTSPDTFTYTLNGGSTATVSMTVTCSADAPVVDTSGTLAYTENDPATVIAPGLTVTDADAGATIAGATVQITTNYAGAQDALALSNAATHLPITASLSGDTLTLTGTASPAAYQAALRDVTYVNISENPSTATRTVTFTVTDNNAQNGSDTRDIQVTAVDDAPVAVDDSATVNEDSGATAVTVLANDTDVDGGPKTISSASDPANGTVVLTGGSPGAHTGLTYQPDPNYCNDPPGTSPDTFTYTLNGGSTATVSMTVTCVNDQPVADDETINGADSAVGNTALVGNDPTDGAPSLAAPKKSITADILAGDTDIDGPGPLAVVPGTFATNDGGSVVIEADGDFTYTPGAGTSCTDTSDFFDYTVTDGDNPTPGTDVGRVTVTIASCVWYVSNNAAGNAGTSTAPFDTLVQAQTASAAGHTIFVFDGDDTTTGYAAGFSLKANQTLTSEVADLVVGSDTLHTGVPSARPTLTDNNADVVELDDNNTVRGFVIDPQGTGGGIAGGLGDTGGGTIENVSITDAGTAGTQPGIELDQTTGTFDISLLTINNSATGVRLNSAGTVNFADAGMISITTAGAQGLDATGTSLGSGSIFDDITVTGATNGAVSMVSTTGTTTFSNLALTTTAGSTGAFVLTSAGTVTVPAVGTANISASGGPAIDVSGTSVQSLEFDEVDSSGSAGDGISLAGIGTAPFTANSSSAISDAAGIDFDLDGGSGAVTYNGTITDDLGQLVRVQNTTGGVKDFNGTISDGGDGDGGGMALTSNSGATIRFDGGLTLATGPNPAFAATAGGTVAVTDPNATGSAPDNTLATTTGRALNVANTTIQSDGLTFRTISSNGAATGVLLNTTGASGRLVVTGNGGTCTSADTSGCSGGQIANGAGADSASVTPDGTGIVLNSTLNPSFTRMWVHDHSNYGIRGTSVAGFTMLDSVVNGVNGTSALTANKDGSVRFEELTGTVTMTNVALSGGYFTNLMVDNTSGVLNATLDNVDSGTLDATGGDDAVQFEGIGTSDMNVEYKNSTITTASGDLFQYIGDGTGGGDLDFTGNTLTNNEPSINTGGGGVALVAGAKGAATMDVLNNTMRDSLTNALTVIKSRDDAAGTNDLVANISNNTIGVGADANSGSIEGDGMEITTFGDGNATFNVTSNVVRQYNSSAMQFVAGSGVVDSGQFNLNISGNTAANPGTNPSITLLQGIRVDSGVAAGDTFATCVKFGANSITGSSDAADKDFRLVASQTTSIRQPGYAGGATDGAAFATFAAGLIGGGAQGTAVANAPATFSGTGSTCP